MRHPNEAKLALHAGGDLGPIARWTTERHLARCQRCRDEVAAFEGVREILPGLAELPGGGWNRLAAEMKANIRLGLAAGECVREAVPERRQSLWLAGGRAAVACASVALLVATGIVLERPAPPPARVAQETQRGVELQATGDGIQVLNDGTATLGLTGAGVRKVTYSLNAQGSMRARSVDPETGQVTVNVVYAQ